MKSRGFQVSSTCRHTGETSYHAVANGLSSCPDANVNTVCLQMQHGCCCTSSSLRNERSEEFICVFGKLIRRERDTRWYLVASRYEPRFEHLSQYISCLFAREQAAFFESICRCLVSCLLMQGMAVQPLLQHLQVR